MNHLVLSAQRSLASLALLGCLAALGRPASAQMQSGTNIPGFAETMGVDPKQTTDPYSVQFVTSSAPANVLWPGEQASFSFQLVNNSDRPIQGPGKVERIAYGTKGRPGDIWVPDMFKVADLGSAPVEVNLPPGKWQNLTVTPKVPETKGAYALVLDLGSAGRRFVTSFVRTFKAERKPVQFPQLCLDNDDPDLLTRLGAAPNRMGIGYKPTTEKDFEAWYRKQGEQLRRYKDAGLAITIEFGSGAFWHENQPLGRPRPWLDGNGVMQDTKFDLAWLPAWDADFKQFCKRFAADYGWPKGPVNGFMLWNEPWEGISISGWGAEMLRYRAMYTALCEGTEEARKEAGVQVLVGGCDSSSNTFDKLFPDGSDEMLKWLDFCSIHYQGMAPPSTVKAWLNRKHPNGRVRIWDTESWVANTDDRVAAVVATNLSTGHDRAVGIYHGNVATEWHARGAQVFGDDGQQKRIEYSHTWSVAASVGATTHFLGERKFRELLFKNGLPWVMVFAGNLASDGKPDPEDGTVVIVGDIGEEFGADNVLFRTARDFVEVERKRTLKKQLAALPPGADPEKHAELVKAITTSEALSGATMTLSDAKGRFALYDFYGNPVPAKGGKIIVPLDHRGFFLRGNGKPGSFAALLQAIRTSRVEGIEPLAKECPDLVERVERKPLLRLRLTNVLNRPVQGTLTVALGALSLDHPKQRVAFAADETKTVELRVTAGKSADANTYPLRLVFGAGKDGRSEHEEDLHVNVIAHRTIGVDGKLDDWAGIPTQTIRGAGDSGPTLQEFAWQPFKACDTSVTEGYATGWLAYDDDYLYFAAKVADSTPEGGMLRFETRDDDQFFYPEKCSVVRLKDPQIAPFRAEDTETPQELTWPAGVRRYSYRRDPDLPAGNAPRHDNVQLAFNVVPEADKPWAPFPPGTMPKYTGYWDTDYEYALNPVAAKYGGGTEIWPLRRPDLPNKHYYPRQPKAPGEGPVKDGKLVVTHEGNTRITECALPWHELPAVRQALDARRPIKFTFRVNDNTGTGCLELSRGRSVAKRNGSFKADWVEHWANELEFGWE